MYPRTDQGVCGGAVGSDAVHAHVVPHMVVATRTLGGRVAPVCGKVVAASA